jgi:hypothetical protein
MKKSFIARASMNHALIRPRHDGAPHVHLFLSEWYDSP